MGYTAGFEPAMMAVNARQTHLEMGDTPIIDKGGYAMIGSDDYFLRMLAAKQSELGELRVVPQKLLLLLFDTRCTSVACTRESCASPVPGGMSTRK